MFVMNYGCDHYLETSTIQNPKIQRPVTDQNSKQVNTSYRFEIQNTRKKMKQLAYIKAFCLITILSLTFYKGSSQSIVAISNVAAAKPVIAGAQLEAAMLSNKVVQINWKAGVAVENADVEIERSTDLVNFKTICYIMASENPDFIPNSPGFKDKTAALTGSNTLYYRLKQSDRDGKVTYSDIITVKIK